MASLFNKATVMGFTNIEIKAKTQRPAEIRNYLYQNGAEFKGTDHQTDTYFMVPQGRLKLRQGNIENTLIYYERRNDYGPKQSDFNLIEVPEGAHLKDMLTKSLGILTVVEKEREIFFIGNVKFHLDTLVNLGNFVEIEASDKYMAASIDTLQKQCEYYMQQFSIQENDLINVSYSDMMLASLNL